MALRDFAGSSPTAIVADQLSNLLIRPRHIPRTPSPIVPWVVDLYSIVGVGVMDIEGRMAPVVAFDASESLPDQVTVPLLDFPPAREALLDIVGDIVNDWNLAFAVGLARVEQQLGPGSVIREARPGTAGPMATWGLGGRGFLTAGHVCVTPGATVYEPSSNPIGTVVVSWNPAVSGAVDLAVVEFLRSTTWSSSPFSSAPPLKGRTFCEALTKKGRLPVDVVGLFAFRYVHSIGGTYANVYQTSVGVSSPGDSGAPVVLTGTDDVVGHIVAGAKSHSLIQDLQYQLQVAATDPRLANISI